MFSRLFGINSHVIGISSVNISPDLDIRILHGFVLIWERLYLFMFQNDLFSCERKFYLFIVFVFMEIWSRYPENIKRIFIFQVTIVFVCKLFMLYSCKRIYFIFSVLIKSDFRLIWAINSFSSTILLYLSDERKEPISTIWSTQRERHAVWSLVDLKALVALHYTWNVLNLIWYRKAKILSLTCLKAFFMELV